MWPHTISINDRRNRYLNANNIFVHLANKLDFICLLCLFFVFSFCRILKWMFYSMLVFVFVVLGVYLICVPLYLCIELIIVFGPVQYGNRRIVAKILDAMIDCSRRHRRCRRRHLLFVERFLQVTYCYTVFRFLAYVCDDKMVHFQFQFDAVKWKVKMFRFLVGLNASSNQNNNSNFRYAFWCYFHIRIIFFAVCS